MSVRPLLFLIPWILLPIQATEEVRVVRLDGEEVVPRSLKIDPSGKAVIETDEGPVEIPIRDLRSISFPQRKADRPMGPALFLAGGGILPGEVTRADGRSVRFRSRLVPEVEIPLSAVRALRLPVQKIDDPAFEDRMEKDGGGDSIFVMSEGKLLRVPGAFRALDSETLSLVWEGQEKTVPREKVYGVVLAGGDAGDGDRSARVALIDGGRLEGEIREMDGEHLRLGLPAGADLTVSRLGVVRIDILSDRLVFVSDLEPEKVEEVPYFNTVWPHRRDRSLDGGPIRLGGKTYEKGLGVHSRCVLTYDLGGDFQTFSAVIGIDDETKDLGHVVFRVRADGETLFDSGGVGGADDPRRIQVDIGGRETLILEVDFGDDLDIGDHADWADAHLVRKS